MVLPAYTGGELSKYTDTMKSAATHRMQVWAETDLVGPCLQGPAAFDAAVEQVAAEAKAVPQITGFKIADELEQSAKSTSTPRQALAFLAREVAESDQSAAFLTARPPNGCSRWRGDGPRWPGTSAGERWSRPGPAAESR